MLVFPNIVLLLKGANVIVAQKVENKTDLFFNTQGCSALAKAGSGDVLAGLIVGLLAQKYSVLDATVTGTLIHGLASKKIEFDFFTLTKFCSFQEKIMRIHNRSRHQFFSFIRIIYHAFYFLEKDKNFYYISKN